MSEELRFELPPAKAAGGSGGGMLMGLLVGAVCGAVVGFFGQTLISGRCPVTPGPVGTRESLLNHDELVQLAETLERNQLFVQAARTWQQAAETRPPQGAEKAKMLVRIGENLALGHQYDEALKNLLAAEAADGEKIWKAKINKLVLESLSALGLEDVRVYQAGKRIALSPADSEAKDKPVAEIGGEPITQVTLDTFARRMVESQFGVHRSSAGSKAIQELIDSQLKQYQSPEGRQRLINLYLANELLYREALAKGLPDRKDVQEALSETRRQSLIRAFMDDYLAEALKFTDTDLKNAYEADKSRYIEPEAVKVQAIVAAESERKAVDDALAGGTDWDQVHAQYPLSPADQGLFEGWIAKDNSVPLVKESKAALAHLLLLKPQEVSGKWFETQDGRWLKFRISEHREQRQLALEECRDRVEQNLRAQKQEEKIAQLQESLRRKFNVKIHEAESRPSEATK